MVVRLAQGGDVELFSVSFGSHKLGKRMKYCSDRRCMRMIAWDPYK